MTQLVDPRRLRQIRTSQDLSQEDLAKKARLNKQTIYRLENGSRPARKGTLERLCRALNVDAEVLSGKKPVPLEARQPGGPAEEGVYQINVRVDAATRNAFSLVALRYKIPASRIVELAPFLFVLAAEGSLKSRRRKLDELEQAFVSLGGLQSNFPHLPITATLPRGSSTDAVIAEEKSIGDRDIFAQAIPNDIYWDVPDEPAYDENEDNPFTLHLKELAASSDGTASMNYFGPRFSTSYQVCREDAIALAGGDEELANGLLNGWALIHEIPRDLLKKEATAQRVEWMRPKIDASHKANEEFLRDLGLPPEKDGAEP